ncbi:MAG: hypothetical protein N2559_04890 [Anaerolineae bacterium]|nr:hypothetical protein [Anaerolineae bacterium]
MLFPRLNALYENLNTSFIQFNALLAELQNTQFTGYVQLVGWEYEGILLFDTGRIVNAVETVKDQQRTGTNAVAGISARGNEKDYAVNVYRLEAEIVQLLANVLSGEPLYRDLSNDLTGLDKLVTKLQNEKHTGSIVVRWTGKKDAATILMRDGQVIECVWAKDAQTSSGVALLNPIIKATTQVPALFTVYRTDLTRVYSADLDLAESLARPHVLTLWQEIFNLVASVIDRSTQADAFNLTFRRVCVDQANVYPFLDPFAGEFEYRNGQIRFEGQATVARFNTGLADCLTLTIRQLATQYASANLMTQLRNATATLRTERAAQLEQLGLATLLPEVFGV